MSENLLEWLKPQARGGPSGQRSPWGNTISWSQANYYAYLYLIHYSVLPQSRFNQKTINFIIVNNHYDQFIPFHTFIPLSKDCTRRVWMPAA
jgi:hypothetical protein